MGPSIQKVPPTQESSFCVCGHISEPGVSKRDGSLGLAARLGEGRFLRYVEVGPPQPGLICRPM